MEEEEKNDGEGKEEEAAEGEQEKKRLPHLLLSLCCLRLLRGTQMRPVKLRE